MPKATVHPEVCQKLRAAIDLAPYPARITQLTLTFLTGVKGEETRSHVAHMRETGAPIGSDTKGYYLARTADEMERTISQMVNRRDALSSVIASLRRTQRGMKAAR
tara:strand:+ start:123 stop:440 length:318 start_codon:yes stop_codon:yes gene_type:complete